MSEPQPRSSNALVRVDGGEIALPADLVAHAQELAVKSLSANTLRAYESGWRHFDSWCKEHKLKSLPAEPETVALYVTKLTRREKPAAISTLLQRISAIQYVHYRAGKPFDAKSPILKEICRGARREIAQTRAIKKVQPLLVEDLEAILGALDPKVLRQARDRAILALGWAGALRRSELVGLDWKQPGKTPDERRQGAISIDERGITVLLLTSKASQDQEVSIAIPRVDCPLICLAVEEYVALSTPETGAPLFYPMDGHPKRATMGRTRLWGAAVAEVVKRQIHLLAQARAKRGKKMTRDDIEALKARFSGHSMRAGYATSAAERDVPAHRIQQQTRHKSVQVLNGYIREADKFKKSALRGVGF